MGTCFVGDNGGSVTPDRLLSGGEGGGGKMGRGKGRKGISRLSVVVVKF